MFFPFVSLPAWGVWIEIRHIVQSERIVSGRSPHGECGLKSVPVYVWHVKLASRSPHGECGLKSVTIAGITAVTKSLPAWGVWIEIPTAKPHGAAGSVAPRMGSVD